MWRTLLATALVMVSGVAPAFAQKTEPPQTKVLSAPGGRYVFGQISDFRKDQYMLDTQTGRLWQIQMVKAKNQDGTEFEYAQLNDIPYAQNPLFNLPPKQ